MFVLDIETVPDETLVETFDKHRKEKYLAENPKPAEGEYEAWRVGQMSLNPLYAKVAGLGYWIEGQSGPVSVLVGDGVKDDVVDEKMICMRFWSLMAHGPCVGFNVINFDVRILRMRSMRLGVPASVNLKEVKPWETDKLWDEAVALSGKWGGATMKETYDVVCSHLEIPEKYTPVLDFNGSMVYDTLQKEGGRDLVRLYQEYDVWREMQIALTIRTHF